MSELERNRALLVCQAVEGVLSQREASERLGIGVRQFKRLVRAWRRKARRASFHVSAAVRRTGA